MIHVGLDTLPGCACEAHLAEELTALVDAVQDRLQELREGAH